MYIIFSYIYQTDLTFLKGYIDEKPGKTKELTVLRAFRVFFILVFDFSFLTKKLKKSHKILTFFGFKKVKIEKTQMFS